MNEDERRLITDFVQRVAGVQQTRSPWGSSAQQGTPTPPLPPVDREADAHLAELFTRFPEARYRITQTAFVQEHAVAEAQNRIQQLEWELEAKRREVEAAASQPKGMLGGLFGSGPSRQQPLPMRPPPQPVHAPGYQQFQQQGRSGSGFAGTAVAAVAGVAGGMLLGNMLGNAFGGAAQAAAPAAAPASDASGWGAAPADQESGWGSSEPQQSGWGSEDEET